VQEKLNWKMLTLSMWKKKHNGTHEPQIP